MLCSQMTEVARGKKQGASGDKRFCFFCRNKRKKIKYNSENQSFTLDNILG